MGLWIGNVSLVRSLTAHAHDRSLLLTSGHANSIYTTHSGLWAFVYVPHCGAYNVLFSASYVHVTTNQ